MVPEDVLDLIQEHETIVFDQCYRKCNGVLCVVIVGAKRFLQDGR